MAGSRRMPIRASLLTAELADTRQWRDEVLTTMLRAAFVFGFATAVPSVLLALNVGLPLLGAIDLLAVASVGVLAIRTDIPYRWRAGSLLVIAYFLGVMSLVTIGTTALVYLMAVPVLATILIGLRFAIAVLVLTTLTLFTLGYSLDASLTIHAMDAMPIVEWAVIALNFAFVSSIITISSGVLLGRLERSIALASRLTRAVEQAREGIVIGDGAGRIAYANAAFATMTGLPVGELAKRSLVEVPLQTPDGSSLAAAIDGTADREGRLVLTRAGEPCVQLEALASPLAGLDGLVSDRIIVVRDVTAERQLEARVRQGERLEALGTLAGGVAHDFNNIIGSILAVAEASREEAPDGRMRENLDRIITASDRARAIVGRMLAFSRQSESERRPVVVRAIVDETLPLLRAALPASIDLRVSGDTDAVVVADPSELNRILMNLATNAAHAMGPRGGGTLSIGVTSFVPDATFASLHPAVREGEPYVRLSVTDTGSGIEPTAVERIFEPFFTTKPSHEGTGLGLATVHGIVTSLGGAIDVYSELGRGATFRVYLPRATTIGSAPAVAPPISGGTGRILLVDDEDTLRAMTERMLALLGYEVTSASDGLAAQRAFEEDPAAYDLVIADLTMPGMGGAALIRALHEARPDLPAILTSGFSDSMPAAERAALGIASFLQKPYTRAELANQVRNALVKALSSP